MTLRKAARAGALASLASLLALLTVVSLLSSSCKKPSRDPASGSAPPAQASPVSRDPGREAGSGVLKLLGLEPSAESLDYVRNKTQFQLHTLLTEQRHPKTWELGRVVATDTLAGLRMLSDVDGDVRTKLEALASDTSALDAAAAAVEAAVLAKRKIYVYGCGATGRLAKQMESAFWRPFWRRARSDAAVWPKLRGALADDIEGGLIGEMTGADRALISSLEGFEDLPLIGRLQLQDRGITKGDVVICVTEGGETSSVIGTILAAHAQWAAEPGYDPAESLKNLYFVYNNPDDRLMPFARSRRVLEEPGITKINLATGPQAITGSTRMQATTIETYVIGTVLEAAAGRVLARFLTPRERAGLGFPERFEIGARLRDFGEVLDAARDSLPSLAWLTDLESRTYAGGRYSTYFAGKGLITVFIDSTERSPTFRLYPLDTVGEPRRRCWIQVWTGTETLRDAWNEFLGRPFRGLDPERYREPFEREIEDPYLKRAALESLKKAGDDQQDLYDFSMAGNQGRGRGPGPGDLGVMVGFTPEEREFARDGSPFRRFMDLFAADGAELAVLLVTDRERKAAEESVRRAFKGRPETLHVTVVHVPAAVDPFGLKQQVAAKMLLNAHSTAVMARLGKVVGNTMTNVSPSNLKLIGRATFLIQSHANDALRRAAWVKARGPRIEVSYAEANAVLFDSIAYLKDRQKEAGQTAEVALSIVRILESFKRGRAVARGEALEIVRTVGLAAYLAGIK
jgi:N-acetylmuramic acid 6-phosphate etherase